MLESVTVYTLLAASFFGSPTPIGQFKTFDECAAKIIELNLEAAFTRQRAPSYSCEAMQILVPKPQPVQVG